MFKNMFK